MELFDNQSERLKPRIDNVLCVGLLSWKHISGRAVLLTPTNRSQSRLSFLLPIFLI